MTYPGVSIEIDWDGDDSFSHTASDVTDDMLENTFQCSRGVNFASQIISRVVSGRMEVHLRNIDGKYDWNHSNSVIPDIIPNRKRIRASVGTNKIWGGYIDDINYVDSDSGNDHCEIRALGNMTRLRGERVSVDAQQNIKVEDAVEDVLSAAGITGSALVGTIDAETVIPRWFVNNLDALQAIRELEATEQGLFYEAADGTLSMQSETTRGAGDYATSALTLTANDDIRKSRRDFEIKRVANIVRVEVQIYSEGTEEELWTSSEDITIPAGESVVVRATYPTPDSPSDHIGVSSWTDLVADTDYTSDDDLTVSDEIDGEDFVITLENTGSDAIVVDDLSARGKALISHTQIVINRQNSDSIATYGERRYPEPSRWFGDIQSAVNYADSILDSHKDLTTILHVEFQINDQWDTIAGLDLSRRITVDRKGIIADFYIESITHNLGKGRDHRVSYVLSPVLGANPPYAPLAPTCDSSTISSITVGWDAPYDGGADITSYEIRYRQTGETAWIDWTRTGVALSTSETITGLTQGMTYDVQIRAVNSSGDGSWSPSGQCNAAFVIPSAPASPTRTAHTSASLTIAWDAPYDGGAPITDYDIRYKRTELSEWSVWDHTGTTRTAIITGLAQDADYHVQVRAENQAGDGAWSASATLATALDSPFVPTSLRETAQSSRTITAAWNSVAFAADYDLQWRVGISGTPTDINLTGTSQKITHNMPGVAIQWRVRSGNTTGDSSWTAWQIPSAVSTPAPTGAATSNIDEDSADLGWTNAGVADDAIDGYEVEHRVGSDGSVTTVQIDSVDTVSHSLTDLTSNTEYQWRVRAKSGTFRSGWTAWLPFIASYAAFDFTDGLGSVFERGVVVLGNVIYVYIDRGSTFSIRTYNATTGAYISAWTASSLSFDPSRFVGGYSGELLIADNTNRSGRVYHYTTGGSATGSPVRMPFYNADRFTLGADRDATRYWIIAGVSNFNLWKVDDDDIAYGRASWPYTDVAVDGDYLYTIDRDESRILRFDKWDDTATQNEIVTLSGLSERATFISDNADPDAISVRDGIAYVLDGSDQKIYRYDV